MDTCLVTGGAGFIGSHLVDELLKQEYGVRVLDNFSTGKRENIVQNLDFIELFEGDLRDMDMVSKCVKGVRYILHQGALPSVPRSVKDPITTNKVNVTGTLNLLVAAKDENVERFVFASSSSVYGDTKISPKSESLPMTPLSPYALSKVTGEEYCRIFYELYGLQTVVLRYFNVFGPRQDPGSPYSAVIPKFINAYLKGESPEIYGDGNQSRDFTYVKNVVNANLSALKSVTAPGKKINIACGQETTVNALSTILKTLTGSKQSPSHLDPRPGDIRVSVADIKLAKDLLDYSIHVPLREGLQKTVDWFRQEF